MPDKYCKRVLRELRVLMICTYGKYYEVAKTWYSIVSVQPAAPKYIIVLFIHSLLMHNLNVFRRSYDLDTWLQLYHKICHLLSFT